jgi:hypothetical protein
MYAILGIGLAQNCNQIINLDVVAATAKPSQADGEAVKSGTS